MESQLQSTLRGLWNHIAEVVGMLSDSRKDLISIYPMLRTYRGCSIDHRPGEEHDRLEGEPQSWLVGRI